MRGKLDAIIHLAGESVFGLWTAKKKRRVLESRRLGTRNLVTAINAAERKPEVLVCASGVGYYGDCGEERVLESAPAATSFFAQTCIAWENETQAARDTLLPRTYWYLAKSQQGRRDWLLAAQSFQRLVEGFPEDSLADDAQLDEDYRIFVHVVDIDEERMWDDDHDPPVPTSQWRPGEPVEYTRTLFVPVFPYVGDATIQVGLHSTRDQQRLTLAGEDMGQKSYRVARMQLLPQTDNLFTVFKDGWHDAEVSEDGALEWQWSRGEGTLSFRNPRRDVQLIVEVDQPVKALPEPQRVTVRVGTMVVDSFALAQGFDIVRSDVQWSKELD